MFSVPDSVVEPHAGAVGGGRARRSLWVVPLVASIAFVTGVLVWAYRTEMDEQTERRSTMIADALSSEAQLRARLDTEMARLEDLGRHWRPFRAMQRAWQGTRWWWRACGASGSA